jgi:hypothetical protein
MADERILLVDLFHLVSNRLEIVVQNVFLNVCNGVTSWNKKVHTEQSCIQMKADVLSH